MNDELKLLANLAELAAHSIIFFDREVCAAWGVLSAQDDRRSTQEDVKTIGQNVADYAPSAIQGIYGTLPGAAEQQANADIAYSKAVAPEQVSLFNQYAPQLAQTGRDIQSADALQAAEDESAIASGPGQGLVDSAIKYQNQIDPQYEHIRGLTSDSLDKLFAGQDPNVLTGSELEAVRRGQSRMPGSLTPSAQNTLENSYAFGDRLRQKRADFSNAIGTATSALPALKSGFSGIDIATRRQGGPNVGTSQFTGVQGGQGAGALQLGNTFLNNAAQIQGAQQAQRKSLLGNVTGWGEFGGKVVGAAVSAGV